MTYAKRCRVNANGQMTIPREIRAVLGLAGPCEIEIRLDESGAVTLHENPSPALPKAKAGRPSRESRWRAGDVRALRRAFRQRVVERLT